MRISFHTDFFSHGFLFHTDLKDFKDVGFADYAYHNVLQGRPLHVIC